MGGNIQLRILLQLYCAVASGIFFTADYEGYLDPVDPQLCTTQNVTFTCTLKSTPSPGNSLGFAVKDASTDMQYVPVEEERVTIVNQTVAKMTLNNVTVRTFVRCFYWDTFSFGDVGNNKKLGFTSTISIYPLPLKLEEINCIVDNYLDAMNCSWDTGRPYDDGLTPKVMFQWRIPSLDKAWNKCPDLNEEYRFCYWSSSNKGDFTMKNIEIHLTQMAECGVNESSTFIVDTRKKVKPRPVTGLTSVAMNSTCIYVQWSTNNSQMQYVKEHRVNITNKWDEPRLYTFNTTNESEKKVQNRTFCNLHPYTKYTFSVSLKPVGYQAGFLSDPVQTEATTYADIPGASPEVVSGGFSWNEQDCKTPSAVRRICVPLKPIKPIDHNGQMKGLVVTFVNEQKKDDIHLVNPAEDLKYVCEGSLLCNTSYKFYIKARNGNGTSKVNSSIEISAFTSGIKQPQFIVEAGNSTYVTLTWQKSDEANTFLVFWCRNRNGQCQEKKDFNWKEFSGNTTEAVIQIDETNSPQDFLYGVSVLTDQGSSGFSWQECIYLKDADPQREVKNLAVSPGPEDNSLVVTWDKLTCQSDQPYVDMYNIQYNKVNDRRYSSVNVSASGEARTVLYNLERDKAYSVTVRAVTKTGQYGPVGKSQIGTPVNNSLRDWQIALIAICVIVGVVVVVVVVIFCMRKYRETKESLEETKNITVPKDDSLDEKQTNGTLNIMAVRQNSNDSGFDPMTPTSDRDVEQPTYPDPLDQKFEISPDGYCRATTVGNSQTPSMENGTPSVVSILPSYDARDNYIPQDPIVADIGFTFSESSGETFVKKTGTIPGDNETVVKTRVKNDSGDSGMSETFAKEMSETSETDVKSRIHKNVDEKNSSTISCIKLSDYVSAENASNPNSFIPGNKSHLNRSSLSALGDLENRGFVTDLNTDSKIRLSLDTTFDYVRAQAAHETHSTQSDFNKTQTLPNTENKIIDVDTVQNHFPDSDFQNSKNAKKEDTIAVENSVHLLNVIPIPTGMGKFGSQNNLSLNDEAKDMSPANLDSTAVKDHMFDSIKMSDDQHFSDVVKVSDKKNIPDYVLTTDEPHMPDNIFSKQNIPNVQITDHQPLADYVQTTKQPSISDYSLNMSDNLHAFDIASSKDSNLTLPSNSGQTNTLRPFNASNISVEEKIIPTVDSMRNSDLAHPEPVSVSSGGYVSPTIACQELNPANITSTHSAFLTESSNYVSLQNAFPSQTYSVTTNQIPRCSRDNSFTQFQNPVFRPALDENTSNGNVSCPDGIQNLDPSLVTNNHIISRNKAIPDAPPQDISGYVLSTDFPSTTSNVSPVNSSTGGQSLGVSPQTNDPLDCIENKKNITSGCQVPNTNGYVDPKFISNGCLKEPSLRCYNKSHSSIGMGMTAGEDAGDEQIRKNKLDLGSNTQEDKNSEIDNLVQQGGSNGYVSCKFAMERL